MADRGGIEPRLTPHRAAAPRTAADTLVEWTRDLDEELGARLDLMDAAGLAWQPHPDANSPGVTVWHVARWLDILGTRAFTDGSASNELWHTEGWAEATGYEPGGKGYLGLGALTGYTPDEMRAVPAMDRSALRAYLGQSTRALITQIRWLDGRLLEPAALGLTPYQSISGTLQGCFGHVGEIDTLLSLRARITS